MRIPVSSPESRPARLKKSRIDLGPIVGAYDGIFAPSFRYPNFSLDELLAQKGYQLVDDMLHLAACRAPFNLKRYAVLQDGWAIEAAISEPNAPNHAQAQELADKVTFALENIRDVQTDLTQDFRAVLFDMMYGAWSGFRLAEIGWQHQEQGPLQGKHGFEAFWAKPNKQIGFDVDTRTLAIKNVTSYTPAGGYDFEIPVEKCVYYVHNVSANAPQGVGDWRACYKHWFRLEAVTKIWAQALERWGAPVLVLSHPLGNEEQLRRAEAVMNRIRQGSPAVVPENIKFELVSAPRAVFVAMERAAIWDTQQIALNINSNILTTNSGANSLALGKVHQDSGNTVFDALSRDIEGVFTQQVIRRFIRYNSGDRALALCPRLRLRKRPEGDVLQIAQMLQILLQGGNLPARSKLIRQQLGLPPLDPEEEKMLDEEQRAERDAEQQLADARCSGKIPALNEEQANQAVAMLSAAIKAQSRMSGETPKK